MNNSVSSSRENLQLIAAMVVAFIAWFFLFAVPGTPFWIVISIATFVLGGYCLIVFPDTLKSDSKSWIRFILMGLAAAFALYLVFALGNIIVRFLSFGETQIESVYSTRQQASKPLITMLLLFPIGPGEELFWRGFVQRILMKKYGPFKGFIFATLLYTLVHLPSLNLTLLAAAFVAGAFWGLLYWKVGHIGPGLISHALWDVAAFTILPFM